MDLLSIGEEILKMGTEVPTKLMLQFPTAAVVNYSKADTGGRVPGHGGS